MRLGSLVLRNIHRHRRSFAFSVVGIVIGVTSFLLFMALGEGLHQNVLERVYVVNQLEVVPRRYDMGAFQGQGTLFGGGTGLDEYTLDDLRALPGVAAVYPKMQLAFPSIAAGGEQLFGRRFWTELIADGIPPDLVRAELPEPASPDYAFRDWDGEVFSCAPGGEGIGAAVGCPSGRACSAEGLCERLWCTPSSEVLAAPDRASAEGVAACLELRLSERTGYDVDVIELPEELRGGLAAELPVRLRVAARHLDETRRALARVLPATRELAEAGRRRVGEGSGSGSGDGTGEGTAEGTGEQPHNPCFGLPSREEVRILRGNEQACEDAPSYCATDTRRCEMPIPVVASNVLFEILDTNMQTVLSGSSRSMPRLTQGGLLGFTFDLSFGRGVLGSALRLDEIGVTERHARLVGWSPRAMRLGLTMPLGYIERLNAAYKDEDAAGEYHSILVLSERSEDLAPIADAVQRDLGLGIDDSYDQAQRGSLMIQLLTLGLLFISALIIFLAALNITHTFLMAIAERRREIGVLRSVGARRRHIKLLVLAEAGLIGLGGAALSVPLALGLAAGADYLLVEEVPDFPFKPDSLFAFEPYIFVVGLAIAILFSLLGAYVPASRASRLDPAEALRAP